MDMDSDINDFLDLLTYDCGITGKKRCAVDSSLSLPCPKSAKQLGNDSLLVRAMIELLMVHLPYLL